MWLADKANELWSGADFWDTDENRHQRSLFRKKREEEARKQQQQKQQEQAAWAQNRQQRSPNTVYRSNSYYKDKARQELKNMSAIDRVKDAFFDSNTQLDQYKRLSEGRFADYRQDERNTFNRRARINPVDQVLGGAAEVQNSIIAGAAQTPETLRGTVADITGNRKAANASLDRQKKLREYWYGDGPNSFQNKGYTNPLFEYNPFIRPWQSYGTIYDSVDEAKNLSPKDTAKRVAGGTLEAASMIPGGQILKGASVALKGGKPLAMFSKKGLFQAGLTGGTGELGYDLNANKNNDWQSASTAFTTGAVAGIGMGIGGELGVRGVSKGLSATGRTFNNFLKNAQDDGEAARALGTLRTDAAQELFKRGVPEETINAEFNVLPGDIEEIYRDYDRRFGDGKLYFTGGDPDGDAVGSSVNGQTAGKYNKRTQNTFVYDGKKTTADHEAVHKAINEQLTSVETRQLYEAVLLYSSGKKSLVKKYQNEGYDFKNRDWRGAAEEEISNLFADWIEYGVTIRGNKNVADKMAKWAYDKGLPEVFFTLFSKLSQKMQGWNGVTKSKESLYNFFDRIESGEFKGKEPVDYSRTKDYSVDRGDAYKLDDSNSKETSATEQAWNELEETVLIPIERRIQELEARKDVSGSTGVQDAIQREIDDLIAERERLTDEFTANYSSDVDNVKKVFPEAVDASEGSVIKKPNKAEKLILDEINMTKADLEKTGQDALDVLDTQMKAKADAAAKAAAEKNKQYFDIARDLAEEGYTEEDIITALAGRKMADIKDLFAFKNEVRRVANKQVTKQDMEVPEPEINEKPIVTSRTPEQVLDQPEPEVKPEVSLKGEKVDLGEPKTDGTDPITGKLTSENEFKRMADLLEDQVSEKQYGRILEAIRNVDTIDGRINYIRKIMRNNLQKQKTLASNVRRINREGGMVELTDVESGELIDTFHVDDIVGEIKAYAKASRGETADVELKGDFNTESQAPVESKVSGFKDADDVLLSADMAGSTLPDGTRVVPVVNEGVDGFAVVKANGEDAFFESSDEAWKWARGTGKKSPVESKAPEPIKTVPRAENPMEQGPVPEKPKVSLKTPETPDELGKMVETFYKDGTQKSGDDVISFAQRLRDKISKQAKDEGIDFEAMASKIDNASKNGVRNITEVEGITPKEIDFYRKVTKEMNDARDIGRGIGKKDIGEGDLDSTYFPNKPKKDYTQADIMAGIKGKDIGSEIKRQNKMRPEEIDFSPNSIAKYVADYADPDAVAKTKIKKAVQNQNKQTIENVKKANPDITDDVAKKAADKLHDKAADGLLALNKKFNNVKVRITLGGAGKEKLIVDGAKPNLSKELQQIGETVGKEQTTISQDPRGFFSGGLEIGDAINSVNVNGKKLGDYTGLNQWRKSINFASKQVYDSKGDWSKVVKDFRNRLETEYDLDEATVRGLVKNVAEIDPDLPINTQIAMLQSNYKFAAKTQFIDKMQTLNITSEKLAKRVDELGTHVMTEGAVERALSKKIVNVTRKSQNAIFRKMNIGSMINELSDVPAIANVAGTDAFKPNFKRLKHYGIDANTDPALQPYLQAAEKATDLRDYKKIVSKAFKELDSKSNTYRLVEILKANMIVNGAEKHYMKKGLKGDALTKKVVETYRETVLPVDEFTKTALDNFPLWTMYMSWGARNIRKEFRLLKGDFDLGKLEDKTRMERIIRNAWTNLPAKTAFWITSNGLKGTAIITALGLTDFTNMTSGDYSGIREEDKNPYEKYVMNHLNIATTASMLNTVYADYRKDELKKQKEEEGAKYNPYENQKEGLGDAIYSNDEAGVTGLIMPQSVKNYWGTKRMREQGYSANKSGRVQYEDPETAFDTAIGYVFGKRNTARGREYSGTPNLWDRAGLFGEGDIVDKAKNVAVTLKDMAKEDIRLKDNAYNRPLDDDYTDAFKKASDGARTALLKGGRQYNKYLDDLKRNDRESYDRYIVSMYGNHISPERWREIAYDDGNLSLNIFKMIGDRKKQAAKDLGKEYDPLYDLPDEQARQVLQMNATATGDDLALRNVLYKEDWFTDYKKKQAEYYENNTYDSDYEVTPRVEKWNGLSDQLYKHGSLDHADQWKKNYPLVHEMKAITDKYGFKTEASDAVLENWGSDTWDAYKKQKDAFDKEELRIINQMREIEGVEPMSWEQYQQATEIADTDTEDDEFGYGSSEGSPGPSAGSFGVSIKGGKIATAGQAPAARRVKPRVAKRKIKQPKVTLKKSKV